MKSLIKNYIELLSIEKLEQFGIKNDIHLNNSELNYLFLFIKSNWENVLLDENKYLNELNNNINPKDLSKIIKLFNYYRDKYKGYLF